MPTEPPQRPDLSALYRALKSGRLVPTTVSDIPDARYRAETQDLDSQRAQAELSGIKLDIEQRKTYADRIFHLVLFWLSAIGVVIFVQGFHFYGFSLDTSVLLMLIGSTTSGVIGLFLIVTRYIFPARTAESLSASKIKAIRPKTPHNQKTPKKAQDPSGK